MDLWFLKGVHMASLSFLFFRRYVDGGCASWIRTSECRSQGPVPFPLGDSAEYNLKKG